MMCQVEKKEHCRAFANYVLPAYATNVSSRLRCTHFPIKFKQKHTSEMFLFFSPDTT